jgi:regulator of CtrA degradation
MSDRSQGETALVQFSERLTRLLLHRAVKEGEMTLSQANREKTKVKLSAADPGAEEMIGKLPPQLQELIARSMALQTKVRRLDTSIHAPAAERAAIGNPLVPQLNRLKAAFER